MKLFSEVENCSWLYPTVKRLDAVRSTSAHLSHRTNLSIILVFMAIRKWDWLT